MAVESVRLTPRAVFRSRRIVDALQGVHASLGRWYWFIMVALTAITLHTFDHTFAAFTNTSPFSESVLGADNTQGFILYHGGLTVLDYTMTIVLLTLLYVRWPEPLPALGLVPHPATSLRRLHHVLGRTYWLVLAAISVISLHTFDHIAAIVWNTSPLSDTFVADSINHEGFLLWHSILTIVDYAMTVWLIYLVYTRWKAAGRVPRGRPTRDAADA